MAYIFIDDGYPDAREYDNNYFYYDADDLDEMERILEIMVKRSNAGSFGYAQSQQILSKAIARRRLAMQQNGKDEEQSDVSFQKNGLSQISRGFTRIGRMLALFSLSF